MFNARHYYSRGLILVAAVFAGMLFVGCGGEAKPKETPGYYDGPMDGKGAAKKPEDPGAKTPR